MGSDGGVDRGVSRGAGGGVIEVRVKRGWGGLDGGVDTRVGAGVDVGVSGGAREGARGCGREWRCARGGVSGAHRAFHDDTGGDPRPRNQQRHVRVHSRERVLAPRASVAQLEPAGWYVMLGKEPLACWVLCTEPHAMAHTRGSESVCFPHEPQSPA